MCDAGWLVMQDCDFFCVNHAIGDEIVNSYSLQSNKFYGFWDPNFSFNYLKQIHFLSQSFENLLNSLWPDGLAKMGHF